MSLSKSIQAYENGINKNDVLKNAQSNLEGIQVLEGVIEPLYNQLSECYLLKYKETDELKYLHQSITIGDNSKDFLISQTNSSVLDRGLLKSKYAKLIKKDKYIQGKLYLFQSGLNSGQTNNKNYVDSLVHYKQESKLFLEHIKNNEYGYYKAKYGESIIEIDKVKGGLDTETLILNFMCYEDNTVVHVIGQNTIKVVKLPRKREWVDNIIELNISLREGGLKKYRKNAPIIYSKLFEPLSSSIPENIKHLIIIPDDEINDLVFGALPTKNDLKNLTYLIEDYAISYQYSIRNFLNKKNTNKDIINKNFLGFAIDGNAENEHLTDSKMSCSSSPLNIARETTNLVSKLFVNAEYSVNNKDEAVLKNMDEGAKVIHFAVHGCVGELNNPLNYHLQLSTEEKEENELDMAEIYNANINAQLVVLSACESGLGQLKRGTGLNSIARAFHFAGCPNTIATTAVVDERATSEVILLFYKYLKSGETIDIALQKAKIDYINSNDRDVEPYSWSNIILIGNPIRINFD
ncbi:MAG: CHAT domain-containing protein [Maribacter sp.]|jgi:CHAT domain-containing protein